MNCQMFDENLLKNANIIKFSNFCYFVKKFAKLLEKILFRQKWKIIKWYAFEKKLALGSKND